MPRPLDGHIAALMSSFAQLKPHGQKRFLEQLNEYLYASAAQRRQLRRQWPDVVIEPCHEGQATGEHDCEQDAIRAVK